MCCNDSKIKSDSYFNMTGFYEEKWIRWFCCTSSPNMQKWLHPLYNVGLKYLKHAGLLNYEPDIYMYQAEIIQKTAYKRISSLDCFQKLHSGYPSNSTKIFIFQFIYNNKLIASYQEFCNFSFCILCMIFFYLSTGEEQRNNYVFHTSISIWFAKLSVIPKYKTLIFSSQLGFKPLIILSGYRKPIKIPSTFHWTFGKKPWKTSKELMET